jgi:hypothetical protein
VAGEKNTHRARNTLMGVAAPITGGYSLMEARIEGYHCPACGSPVRPATESDYNAVPNATFTNFNENEPLRNLAPVVDTVPGASAIQEYLDRLEWAQQAANPVAYGRGCGRTR